MYICQYVATVLSSLVLFLKFSCKNISNKFCIRKLLNLFIIYNEKKQFMVVLVRGVRHQLESNTNHLESKIESGILVWNPKSLAKWNPWNPKKNHIRIFTYTSCKLYSVTRKLPSKFVITNKLRNKLCKVRW